METIGSSDSGNENEGTDVQAPVPAQIAKSKGKSNSVLTISQGKQGENLETDLGPRVKQAYHQIQVKT